MIILKPYTYNDYEHINHYFPKNEINKYINKGKYRLMSLIGIYRSQFMILWEEDKVIGCGVIRRKWSRDTLHMGWWLYAIWIEPSQRGRGVSKILMNELINELKSKGVKQVYLTVAKDNIIAQNLYNKIGFVQIGENTTDLIMRYDI